MDHFRRRAHHGRRRQPEFRQGRRLRFATSSFRAPPSPGAPAQFEQQREDGTTARGRANTIDYETASGTVSFNDRRVSV